MALESIHDAAAESRIAGLPAAYAYVDPQLRSSIAPVPPRVVFIEVTNACNLLCETCPHTFAAYEPVTTMSWQCFVEITEQFPQMQRATLHGIGEPLLNRDLPRMIEHLKQRGVTVLFNTNAVLLDGDWAHALISSGLDELRCSLDAADAQTFARIRGVALFDRVVANLTQLTRLQRKLHVSKPRISLWMTGMKENIAALPGLVRLADAVGVPEVYLQRMVYYLGDATPSGLMQSDHSLLDDYDGRVEHFIAEAETLAARLHVRLQASGATDPRHSLAASLAPAPCPWQACMRPWTTAYVTANGNCLPCCISPFATQDYDSVKLGNLFDTPFAEIWNGELYQRWRQKLLSERPSLPCTGCGVDWSL
jgi:MoaA/NifB/PqqE/SkfB family radical SAM enzyme